jgi:acetylornithine deacetylase/succinyl-diaminopimelate desuccinylase-like protein
MADEPVMQPATPPAGGMATPGTAAAAPSAGGTAPSAAEQEVARICAELIRIDTSNAGDGSGPGERGAAEYVAGLLADVGLEPELFESAPGRASVVVRLAGADPARPALVLHGHTDVVPARAEDWSVPPFAGEEVGGVIWGRGAVDMKDMDAMVLAVVRQMVREGRRPARDVVVAMFADEEAGGGLGARWAVDHRPELFEGATEAISEVGGYSVELGGRRAYLVQTAEKGLVWLRLVADGRAGHGSQVNRDNAVTLLAEAVARIGRHPWPLVLTPTVRRLLQGVADLVGLPFDPDDEAGLDALVAALGPASRFVGATLRHTANPTRLEAGYANNVIPGRAEATLDGRFLPGLEEEFDAEIRRLAGDGVRVEDRHRDVAASAPLDGPLVDAMADALLAEDPGAAVLPYMLSAGTDNKSLARLGIHGYGFVPLRLPAGYDFPSMFHGVDERVPVDALRFGCRVLDRLLATC